MVSRSSPSSHEGEPLSRRAFVRRGAGGAAAAATAAAAAGSAGTAGAQETHTVDMTDGLVFDPDELTIAPGDTVVWETVGSVGHSVTAYEDEIPEEADYFASGGFDSEEAARNAYPEGDVASGETYEHTFEVEGEYGYFCIPHESAGMVASLTVQEGGGGDGGGGGGGGGGGPPAVPESARTLALATMFGLLSTLGLAYFFMRYGGDYGTEEE
ncbi:MAG: plastocyanin/azurin family copper-binding protein [Haloarculaceae archaeon]